MSGVRLLTVQDLQDRWQCGETAVRELYRFGGLPYIKLTARMVRFDLAAVERFEQGRALQGLQPVTRTRRAS